MKYLGNRSTKFHMKMRNFVFPKDTHIDKLFRIYKI